VLCLRLGIDRDHVVPERSERRGELAGSGAHLEDARRRRR
jgi:hypothetical protein